MVKDNKTKTCPLCGATQQYGQTMFSVDLGFGVVVVRKVPALVCEMCGESFIEDSVAEELEKIVEQARERERTVEVVQYNSETSYSLAS